MTTTEHVTRSIIHHRPIEGLSAIFLPFDQAGRIDFDGFARHLTCTADAGLTPAVNMDTGFVNLLTPDAAIPNLKLSKLVFRPFWTNGFEFSTQPLESRKEFVTKCHEKSPKR